MRELKFRIWDKLRKKWYSFENQDYGDGFFLDTCGEFPDCNEYAFTQYTGLKDKNGIEIYEGDVFQEDAGQCVKFLVEFNNGNFILRYGKRFHIVAAFLPHGKVIGNIYENPELMESDNGQS